MRIGLSIDSTYPDEDDPRVGARHLIERCVLGEQLGFDSLFLGDHSSVGRGHAVVGTRTAGHRRFTVAAESARIGEAYSSYQNGVISAMNELARRAGAGAGMEARPVLVHWAEAMAERDPLTP
jgi:alkanesulfonate monooxygenase SsuD/methylene tetrahydromethanopterin reductase-like flavin-dependent oxidoreductase (luciferase family)